MTREEAINVLAQVGENYRGIFINEDEVTVAFDMAIKALSQPIICKDYLIDDDHIYCSPKVADKVVEALKAQDGVYCTLAERTCFAQGKEFAWCITCPHISEEDKKLVKRAIEGESKWIPCSEKLPEMYDKKVLGDYDNSKAVFVTIQYHGELYVSERSVVYCSDGVWRYPDDNDEVHEIEDAAVMAWMPPPEPYKPESEDKE